MQVTPVPRSQKLFAISEAIGPELLQQVRAYWQRDGNFRRRVLEPHCDLITQIDSKMQSVIEPITALTGKMYYAATSTWHVCEPGFQCPMHTDGPKPNVLIMYWISPGQEFGTTFYNSDNYDDVFHEFHGTPNTGFFADYESDNEPCSAMWHASNRSVPEGSYRLMTLYELHR